MGKEIIKCYPTLIDPFLDLEVSRQYGPACTVYNIQHHKIENGRTLVCMGQQRETNEPVYHEKIFIGRKYEHGIIIAGDLVRISVLFRRKVRVIPESEREEVEFKLLRALERMGRKKSDYVDFWR